MTITRSGSRFKEAKMAAKNKTTSFLKENTFSEK